MAEPCRVVKLSQAVRWLYVEMLYEEITNGVLAKEVDRNGLLYMVALLKHANRQTSETFVSRSEIADQLGLPSRGHTLKVAKDAFVRHGFLVENGKAGRSDRLLITFPEELHPDWPDLADATDGPLLNVGAEKGEQ